MKRGRPRGSENNPIDFGESQESNHSLLNRLDALQVDEEIEPELYSPPASTAVRRTRSGVPLQVCSEPSRIVVDGPARGSRSPRSGVVEVPKLAVSGFIVEHLKSGQYIAPQNAIFVYDISDSRSVRTVQKKMNKIRKEFPDKTLHEFTTKGTAGILPTSVGGASVGVLTATVAKCFQSSKRARTSSPDDD